VTADQYYGWAAGLGCLAACFSKSRSIESVALIIVGAWLASNIVYAQVQQPHATPIFWLIDTAAFGLLFLTLWREFRPAVAFFAATWIFLTVWDLAWFLVCPPSFYVYDLVSNIVFSAHICAIILMSYRNKMINV
jgi:hypothetical protein